MAVHGLKGMCPQSLSAMHGRFKCVLIWECQRSLGVRRGHTCWNLVALVELLLWSPMRLAVAPFRTSLKPTEHLALRVPTGPPTFLPPATVVSQKHNLSCL